MLCCLFWSILLFLSLSRLFLWLYFALVLGLIFIYLWCANCFRLDYCWIFYWHWREYFPKYDKYCKLWSLCWRQSIAVSVLWRSNRCLKYSFFRCIRNSNSTLSDADSFLDNTSWLLVWDQHHLCYLIRKPNISYE